VCKQSTYYLLYSRQFSCIQPVHQTLVIALIPVAMRGFLSDSFKPPIVDFTECDGIMLPPGIVSSHCLPLDFFTLFITHNIVLTVVRKTNRYTEQYVNDTPLKPNSRVQHWKETHPCEMKKFTGILLLVGIVQKSCINSYWSTDAVIATPLLNKIMPHNRFKLLLKFRHVADNSAAEQRDRLNKLNNHTTCEKGDTTKLLSC